MTRKSWVYFLLRAFGLLCLAIPIRGMALDSPPKLGEHRCNTDDCIVERLDTATHVMKFRDSDVDPCENMFQFVCGNYDGTDFSHTQSKETEAKKALLNSFIGVMEAIATDFKPFKMIEDLHDVCTDDKARNEHSVTLLEAIIRFQGGWPMVEGDEWKEEDFDWMKFVENSKRSGYVMNFFIDCEAELDVAGEDKLLIFKMFVAPPYFEFMKAMEESPAAYKEYMTTIAKALGATRDVEKDVDDVIDFEKKLRGIETTLDDKSNQVMAVPDLQTDFPGINWENFANKLLKPFMDKGEEPAIAVWNAEALKEFIKLMDVTPKRVQANYAIWRMVQQSVSFLSPVFTKVQEEFWKKINYEEGPEEEFCDETAKFYMEEAMDYFFVHQLKTSSENVQDMVQSIKDAMVAMMKQSKVLKADDIEKASKVISDMPVTMGPSQRFSDPKELESLYEETEIDKTNFLQTLINLNQFRLVVDYSRKLKKDLNFIIEQPDILDEPKNIENHLYIPTELLDSSMFDNDRPMYINYGALGPFAAREMFGSVDEFNLMTAEDKPTPQVQCFQNLYNNLTDPNSGAKMETYDLTALIGQLVGMRAAYKAYKDYEAKNGPEAPLPEVPHTVEQLFWMSHMSTYCKAKTMTEEDPNVEGTNMKLIEFVMQKLLAQIPEVAEDFSCPAGSMLNPEVRCDWW